MLSEALISLEVIGPKGEYAGKKSKKPEEEKEEEEQKVETLPIGERPLSEDSAYSAKLTEMTEKLSKEEVKLNDTPDAPKVTFRAFDEKKGNAIEKPNEGQIDTLKKSITSFLQTKLSEIDGQQITSSVANMFGLTDTDFKLLAQYLHEPAAGAYNGDKFALAQAYGLDATQAQKYTVADIFVARSIGT